MGDYYLREGADHFFVRHPGPWRFADAGLLLMDGEGSHVAWFGRGGHLDPNLRPILLAVPELFAAAAELLQCVEASPAGLPRATKRLRSILARVEGLSPCPEPINYAI